jgi:predicted RNA-binding protein with PIN domain
MIIVVDAYNLLRSMPPYKKTITDQERKRFIASLGAYGRRKDHKMVIVFDGGQYEWPSKERINTVLVVYSGIRESADDYIKEYLEAQRAKDVLLVSSDSELNRFAASRSIPSIDSSTFYELVQQELGNSGGSVQKKPQEVVRLAQDNQPEIDLLMEQASKIVPTKSEDIAKSRSVKAVKPGKQERVLLKKLKKL